MSAKPQATRMVVHCSTLYIIHCFKVHTILSLLAAHITSSPEEIQESSETTDGSPQVSILLPVVITTVSVAVLLMLVGLLHCLKHKGKDQFYMS